MSGGSRDYMPYWDTRTFLEQREDVAAMAKHLVELGHSDAAQAMEEFYVTLEHTHIVIAARIKALQNIMHAVELVDSGDWGKDQLAEAVKKWGKPSCMTNITIPFLPEWKEKMLAGIKTHTCRSKAYGQPGDRFTIFGATFELIAVWQTTLTDVAINFYRQEGCASVDEYIQVWNKIHRKRGYIPTDVKWLHHFKMVNETAPSPTPGDGGMGSAMWNG